MYGHIPRHLSPPPPPSFVPWQAMWPWIHALHENYDDAANAVFNDFKAFPHVKEWYARCLARPASQVHRGLPR